MPAPCVLVLYNQPILPLDHPDADSEQEVLYSVGVVADSLTREKMAVARLGIAHDPAALLEGLKATSPDVVFNLYEGTADQGGNEAAVGSVLEWLRVPYTGCPAQSMVLSRDKPLGKLLLKGAGIETPEYFVVERGARCPKNPLGWPVIVKPGREDGSVGIDQGAVVTSDRRLKARVEFLFANYDGPALVERFVPGREIHATVVEFSPRGGPTVLPLAEIRFEPDEKLWPIYTYDAKWKEQSREYEMRPVDVGVKLPADVTDRVTRATLRTYELFGCLDHARVDIRLAPDGAVYVLECNPNPSITSVTLDFALTEVGWQYDQFMAQMVRNALARGGSAGVNPYGKPASPRAAG